LDTDHLLRSLNILEN